MIMADVLKIFLIVVGLLIVLVSYWLAAQSLFPRIVHRAWHSYSAHPLRATLIGTLAAGPLVAIGLGLLQAGAAPVKALGFLMVATAVLGALLGSAGLARRIGAGLPSAVDAERPWRQVLRGGIVLSLTFLLPFVGWFLILPLTLLSGFGTALGAAYSRWRERAPEPAPDPGVVAP
ncbi:MAG: hypothetical protein GY719_25575 [bacterium]|nr:hypothetical protein [bacterium]